MSQSTPEPVLARDGDRTVVEALTAAQALATVHEQLGAGAEIVGADKVLRGGLWGFFPKEHVQLTVRTRQPENAEPKAVPVTDPAAQAAATQTAAEMAALDRIEQALERAAETAPHVTAPTASADTAPTASTDSAPIGPTEDAPTGPTEDAPTGLAAVLAHLSASEDDREEGLGSALRRHLGVRIAEDEDEVHAEEASPPPPAPAGGEDIAQVWAPPVLPDETPLATPAVTDVTTPEPAVGDELPRDDVEASIAGGPAWSGRNLLRLGLPRSLVDGVLAQEPHDDASWLYALARVLSPLCRPLPSGAAMIAGPRAERFAKALGVPLVRLSSTPRGSSTFAAAVRDSANGRAWLQGNRGDRWLHVLAGGTGWRGLLFADALAISWVGEESIGEAIGCAHELGLVLGYGLSEGNGADAVRATPVDLAIAVRAALAAQR